MKTIEIYEKAETSVLRELLKEYEENSEKNEIFMDFIKNNNQHSHFVILEEIKKINTDYEIDISLIRMELNKRLWNE